MSTGQKERPAKIDKDIIKQILIKYKKNIIKPDLRIISKKDLIWILIVKELNDQINPNTLYNNVTNTT